MRSIHTVLVLLLCRGLPQLCVGIVQRGSGWVLLTERLPTGSHLNPVGPSLFAVRLWWFHQRLLPHQPPRHGHETHWSPHKRHPDPEQKEGRGVTLIVNKDTVYIYLFLSSYSDTAHLLFIYRPFLPTMASDHLRILFRIVCPWFLSLLKRTSSRCWKMTTKFCATVPGWWVHRHSCDLLCVSAFVLQSKTCWIHITFYYTDLGFMSLLRFYDLTVKLLEPCSRVSSRGCFVLSSKSSIHS